MQKGYAIGAMMLVAALILVSVWSGVNSLE